MEILIIDDHCMFRSGIKQLILKMHEGAQIFEASNAEEGLQKAVRKTLDLIFLDLKIPQENSGISSCEVGLNMLKAFSDREKCTPVIVMTGELLSMDAVRKILKAGAVSFVPKTSSSGDLIESIQRALGGGVWLPLENEKVAFYGQQPSIDNLLRDTPLPVTAVDLGITEREFDILRLAMQGNAPWKIAKILDINPTNTRRYLSKLYSQFGVIDLYGLQCHFAKTGHLLGIISAPSRPYSAKKPFIKDML